MTMPAPRHHGCHHDPAQFLATLKASRGKWSPMAAARLAMGPVVDSIRANMGVHWVNFAMAAHLSVAKDAGEWSFAHETMRVWLDYQKDLIETDEYRQRLVDLVSEGMRTFVPHH